MMGAIQDILDRFGDETIQIISDNMRAADQVATGDTLASLGKTSTEFSLQVFGAPYIMALETGRRPRQSNQDSGLASKLERWIVAKGVSIRRSVEQDAKSLAWFINKYGTKLFREGGRKDVISPALSQERINKLVKDITVENLKEATITIKTAIDERNTN